MVSRWRFSVRLSIRRHFLSERVLVDAFRRRKCLTGAVVPVCCVCNMRTAQCVVCPSCELTVRKHTFADFTHQIGGGLLHVLVFPSDWATSFPFCYLTRMEQAFPFFLSREIVVCVSALVISPEWNRLPDVFISRDCMFFSSC
jgi:hypothetical protein